MTASAPPCWGRYHVWKIYKADSQRNTPSPVCRRPRRAKQLAMVGIVGQSGKDYQVERTPRGARHLKSGQRLVGRLAAYSNAEGHEIFLRAFKVDLYCWTDARHPVLVLTGTFASKFFMSGATRNRPAVFMASFRSDPGGSFLAFASASDARASQSCRSILLGICFISLSFGPTTIVVVL